MVGKDAIRSIRLSLLLDMIEVGGGDRGMTVVLVISYHHYTAFTMVYGSSSSSMITITMV